jgi:hypothetical protein
MGKVQTAEQARDKEGGKREKAASEIWTKQVETRQTANKEMAIANKMTMDGSALG